MTECQSEQVLERTGSPKEQDHKDESLSRFVSEILMSSKNLVQEIAQKKDSKTDTAEGKSSEKTEGRQMEYFYKMFSNTPNKSGETFFYVSRDKNQLGYKSFKMFTGTPPDLDEVKIDKVTRYRDGGTTIINTKDGGTFFVPTVFEPEKKATFNGMPLEKADPRQFNIKEDEHGLSIRRKL